MKKFKISNSLKLYREALNYLPGGVSSNARLWRSGGICPPGLPCELFVKKAKGSHIWDVDGNEYIDYRLGYGPVILGHDYHYVSERVHQAEHLGAVYAMGNKLEIEVAKKIKSLVPCAEMLRFSNTGTEATMHACRIARAYTGKEKIIKFEGHFHGTHDYLAWNWPAPWKTKPRPFDQEKVASSTGIPRAIKDLVIVEKWNDFDAIEKTVKKYHHETAAIITEPVMGNAGAIMPKLGYLKHLRELCDKYGIVLIFDEVKTGFRIHPGGAQKYFKVIPDIATIAKAMGNGYPVSAICGKKEIMSLIKRGGVTHGGTYSSNPISLTAVSATLDLIKTGKVHEHINSYGRKFMKTVSKIFSDHQIKHLVLGFPGMFQFAFTNFNEINDFRDLQCCELATYPKLQRELLQRGVMVDADIEEPHYICYSHSKADFKQTINAFSEACIAACADLMRGRHNHG